MSYSKLKSHIANVNAIETAMAIRLEKRKATPSEKETLSLYSGFGRIKEILEIGSDRPVSVDMAEQIKRLENLISTYPHFTDFQCKEVIVGIKASVLTAFYTPQYVIDVVALQIQSLFNRNDIFMRSFLEPVPAEQAVFASGYACDTMLCL